VPLALDVVVAVGALKRLRADPQDAVVEDVEDVEARQIAADVAGSAGLDEPQQGFAILDGLPLKVALGQHVFFGVRRNTVA